MILCLSSRVVPSCMQAAEGADGIVLTAPLCHTVEQDGGVVEQEEMVATKSCRSEKSSSSNWA